MNKAAKLLSRFESPEGILGSEFAEIIEFTSADMWNKFQPGYPELGLTIIDKMGTALLFMAAGVEPEEFL